jgi:transcriptional regulator with XRE-family HTH domain
MDNTLCRILSLIKERKIPKGKFLADLGIDRSALSEWVKGKHKSYMKYLPQIASYFDVSVDWLSGNEKKNKPPMLLDDLTPHELELIKMLREGPEDVTAAVYRAVGIDPEEK